MVFQRFPKDHQHIALGRLHALVDLESQIKAADLKLPNGVELKTDADEIVAIVAAAKEEVEEAAPVDLSAIEISVEKGKKEEEAVAAAKATPAPAPVAEPEVEAVADAAPEAAADATEA